MTILIVGGQPSDKHLLIEPFAGKKFDQSTYDLMGMDVSTIKHTVKDGTECEFVVNHSLI